MIITLLTDFGLTDHYVASLKGAILTVDQRIRIVDISHEVPPFDRWRAAFLLAACHRAFPAGTVHVVVVDPGVGSARRPLAARAWGSYFIGPDNGVLGLAVQGAPDLEVMELDIRNLGGGEPSATFHGRDIFAPAAAALATGTPLDTLGVPAREIVDLEGLMPKALPGGRLRGRIVHVDRFGNCVTSFRPEDFPGGEWRRYSFRSGEHRVNRTVNYYDEANEEEPVVLLGSVGYLEVAIKRDSAAERLSLRSGDRITAEKAGGDSR